MLNKERNIWHETRKLGGSTKPYYYKALLASDA